MKLFLPSIFSAFLCSCGASPLEPTVLSKQELNVVLERVLPKLIQGQRIIAVCGPSSGSALWLRARDGGKAMQEKDGISNGRAVFIDGNAGPDVIYLDAASDFESANSDGGAVSVIHQKRRPASSWIVSYASTGVVQTHNLAFNADGQLVNIWTANKPDGLNPAHVFTFTSNCVQP